MDTTTLTVEQAAGHLRVSPQTVRRWIRNGELKATKQGRDYAITPEQLAASLKEHTVPMTADRGH